MWHLTAAALCALTLTVCARADDTPLIAPPRPAHVSDGPLVLLDFFIGDWEIDATWAWGDRVRARNAYRVGLGGAFVEVSTVVRDNDGPAYERYFSVYTSGREGGGVTAIGLTADGSVTDLPCEIEKEGESIVIRTDFAQGGSRIRQRVQTDGPDAYTWKVWMSAPGDETERLVMDGVWRRVSDARTGARPENGADDPWASSSAARTDGPHPIDPNLFAASGAQLRSFSHGVEIDAPPAEVFGAWATADGWGEVFDMPGAGANIDLAIGGRYEWLFDGRLGSNGCQILSYIPDRMISFTWNAPPTQPESRRLRTWVVVELDPNDKGGTDVTLTHLGFGDAEHWDETERYFQNAWQRVLSAMQAHFASDD